MKLFNVQNILLYLFHVVILFNIVLLLIVPTASYKYTVTIEPPGKTETSAKFDYVGVETFDS